MCSARGRNKVFFRINSCSTILIYFVKTYNLDYVREYVREVRQIKVFYIKIFKINWNSSVYASAYLSKRSLESYWNFVAGQILAHGNIFQAANISSYRKSKSNSRIWQSNGVRYYRKSYSYIYERWIRRPVRKRIGILFEVSGLDRLYVHVYMYDKSRETRRVAVECVSSENSQRRGHGGTGSLWFPKGPWRGGILKAAVILVSSLPC